MLFRRTFSVPPNHTGFLYKKNRLVLKLEPGIYRIFDWRNETQLLTLPTTNKLQTVTNQEVLTSDNVALRFSYFIEYRIGNPDRFITKFNVTHQFTATAEAEQLMHSLTQVHLRRIIAQISSEELNERRDTLLETVPETLRTELADYGIEVVRLTLRDISFPKQIQDLFARHLEAKIRAKADLENARTAVATARALKNATELMKGDDNIRFFQYLEAITKIADKGKHTFIIGELPAGVPRDKLTQ
ncbi:MAG: slipin family protein [Pyrinomonadaceae bacterium MAG19_C2-C3]|nr:slipin family protein [Pyrinomonadaceae bacterium MAG19_C2-C3]